MTIKYTDCLFKSTSRLLLRQEPFINIAFMKKENDRLTYKRLFAVARAVLGLQKQTEIAAALEISPQRLQNWKSGRPVPPSLYVSLAARLKVTVDDLLHGDLATFGPEDLPSGRPKDNGKGLSPEAIAFGRLYDACPQAGRADLVVMVERWIKGEQAEHREKERV